MTKDSSAAARRAVEAAFDEFEGIELLSLSHVEHTDFEHVFSFAADCSPAAGPRGIPGRYAVQSGPVRWIEVELSPVERTPVEVVGFEEDSDTNELVGVDDDEQVTGAVHCWHG